MCTVIFVGPGASADGSTLLSHSDTGQDSRIRRVPARRHAPGSLAAVHGGLQEIRSADLNDHGEVLGHIPQVTRTHAYFHSAYSQLNEHRLALAESTISQRPELIAQRGEGEQILTIEQAMVFALQRCKRAAEAVALIGRLMERHGFLPSCGDGGELLVLADPEDAWVLEVLGVGKGWTVASGQPGALWAARRIGRDQTLIAANWSLLRELDPADPDVRIGTGVEAFAIARSWQRAGQVLNWQQAFIPLPREFAIARLWLFHQRFVPNLRAWPQRQLGADRHQTLDAYNQVVEPLDIYPFSVRPERALTLGDVMDFHRSAFEGTVYDLTEQPHWWVQDADGQSRKSELATPFPGPELRRLLRLTHRRPVARHFGHYSAICQLPAAQTATYWVALDNPLVSTWLPLSLALKQVPAGLSEYDPERFSEGSARWAVDFVDNLMRLGFQTALPLLRELRDPFQASVIARWQQLDPGSTQAQAFAQQAVDELLLVYREIRQRLLVRLGNNRWT